MAKVRSTYNDIRAGLLVLVSLIAALVVVIILSGSLRYMGTRPYTVHFPIDEGVPGLEVGGEVRLGGMPVGVVDSIRFGPPDADTISRIEVRINVTNSIQLREGAVATLERPIIGAQSTINFPATGTGNPLTKDDAIPGRQAVNPLLAQAGYGDEEAESLRNIFARAEDIAVKIDEAVTEFRETILGDVQAVTGDLRTRWPQWSERVDSVTRKADSAMGNFEEAGASARVRLDQLEELLATAQRYLDENRADVRDAVRSARSASERADNVMARVEGEIIDQVEGLFEDGRAAVADARSVLERVDGVLIENRADLRKSMANLRLASDSMRSTMEEVRRAPWRLLYRPDTGEMEYELLYDSARIYAQAVSDLRSASESLETMIETGGRAVLRGEDLRPLLDHVLRSFDKYKQAEQNFLDLIIEEE